MKPLLFITAAMTLYIFLDVVNRNHPSGAITVTKEGSRLTYVCDQCDEKLLDKLLNYENESLKRKNTVSSLDSHYTNPWQSYFNSREYSEAAREHVKHDQERTREEYLKQNADKNFSDFVKK